MSQLSKFIVVLVALFLLVGCGSEPIHSQEPLSEHVEGDYETPSSLYAECTSDKCPRGNVEVRGRLSSGGSGFIFILADDDNSIHFELDNGSLLDRLTFMNQYSLIDDTTFHDGKAISSSTYDAVIKGSVSLECLFPTNSGCTDTLVFKSVKPSDITIIKRVGCIVDHELDAEENRCVKNYDPAVNESYVLLDAYCSQHDCEATGFRYQREENNWKFYIHNKKADTYSECIVGNTVSCG